MIEKLLLIMGMHDSHFFDCEVPGNRLILRGVRQAMGILEASSARRKE
jgi:hypothetical protein